MKNTSIALFFALACGAASPSLAQPADASKTAPAAVKIVDGQLVLPGPLSFEGDTATLTAESQAALAALRDYLKARPDVTLLRIEGHLAASGEAALMMSGERAFAIGGWLRDQGVDCKRLLAAAFGDTKPVVARDAADARARNTRITLVPAALRGKAIGGMPVDGGAPLSTDVCPE